jgi:hypothetical protein
VRCLVVPPLVVSLLLAAGCAVPGPERAAPLTPSAAVAPSFPVPSTRQRMVSLARQEWALSGSPVVIESAEGPPTLQFAQGSAATHELQPPMLARVLMYWYRVSRLPAVGHAGELRQWSAAFVSWLAAGAGLAPVDFPPTVLHWDYIERFLAGHRDDPFMTRDPAHYGPRLGDLVCNVRDGGPAWHRAPADFSQLRRGAYHCEVVVAASPDAIETIGGNVGDTVALTRLALDSQGLLLPHPRLRWAAVLENRTP